MYFAVFGFLKFIELYASLSTAVRARLDDVPDLAWLPSSPFPKIRKSFQKSESQAVQIYA